MIRRGLLNIFRTQARTIMPRMPINSLFQLNSFQVSELTKPNRSPSQRMKITHSTTLDTYFRAFPLLSENIQALPQISIEVKRLRKNIQNMDKKKRFIFLQTNNNCNTYIKDLINILKNNATLDLSKYPLDLMNLLTDLHYIDNTIISNELLDSLVKNQLCRVTNIDPLFILTCVSLLSKVEIKNQEFWDFLKRNITPTLINNLTTTELVNLTWGLGKAEQLNEKLYSHLNNLLLNERYKEMNFTDIATLANLYSQLKDQESLIALSKIVLQLKYAMTTTQISARSISNLFYDFTFVHKLIGKEVWVVLVREYLLKHFQNFMKPHDIAQLLVSINRIKGKLRGFDTDLKKRLESKCIALIQYFISQMQGNDLNKKILSVNEQDLCNVLFAAINLEFIPQNLIELLTQSFVENLNIIKPLGMGYCLHALATKKKDLLDKYSKNILDFLGNYQGVTRDNIGYLLKTLENLPKKERERSVNNIVDLIIKKRAESIFNLDNCGQFFYAFSSLQVIGKMNEVPQLANKMISAFLLIDPQNIKEHLIFEYSRFSEALLLLHDNKLNEAKKPVVQKFKEVTREILNFIEPRDVEMRGFGSLVYNISKSKLDDQEIWSKIKDVCRTLDMRNWGIMENIDLLKGIQTREECKELYEELKQRVFQQKIKCLPLINLDRLLSNANDGKETIKFYEVELRELIKGLKNIEHNKQDAEIVKRLEQALNQNKN